MTCPFGDLEIDDEILSSQKQDCPVCGFDNASKFMIRLRHKGLGEDDEGFRVHRFRIVPPLICNQCRTTITHVNSWCLAPPKERDNHVIPS